MKRSAHWQAGPMMWRSACVCMCAMCEASGFLALRFCPGGTGPLPRPLPQSAIARESMHADAVAHMCTHTQASSSRTRHDDTPTLTLVARPLLLYCGTKRNPTQWRLKIITRMFHGRLRTRTL